MLTTGKVYKVWIEIEEYDIESGDGQNIDCPTGCTATFATDQEAFELAQQMQRTFEDAPGQVDHA